LDWSSFALEAARGSALNLIIMAAIIIPIMISLEAARDLNLLDRFSGRVAPLMKFFGMSPEASFPLLVGMFFGIGYGGGVIIDSARSGRISWRDMFLVYLFLSVCHAVIEDTALFMAIGADPLIIILGRLAIAVVITCLAGRSRYLAAYEKKKSQKGSAVTEAVTPEGRF